MKRNSAFVLGLSLLLSVFLFSCNNPNGKFKGEWAYIDNNKPIKIYSFEKNNNYTEYLYVLIGYVGVRGTYEVTDKFISFAPTEYTSDYGKTWNDYTSAARKTGLNFEKTLPYLFKDKNSFILSGDIPGEDATFVHGKYLESLRSQALF